MAALCATLGVAEARPAQCFTTDDGNYPCDFRPIGGNGSFVISAPGVPTYTLDIVERGVANGFVNFGGKNVFLPGLYLRSRSEPACWVNDSTGARICAW